MKVVILCGGMGTRLREETEFRPKPLVDVGNRPILWHIMNIFSSHGYSDFIVALGYKGEMIKEYFVNYHYHQHDLIVNLRTGAVQVTKNGLIDWTVCLVDTGLTTATGGRLNRLRKSLDSTFMLTYGDGVANIDIDKLLMFHRSHGKIATVTAVRPVARFGEISLTDDRVVKFKEKPQTGAGWINGGFMVFEPGIFRYLDNGDQTVLEADTLEHLAADGQLAAYRHEQFWQCMDTLRDKRHLESLWEQGKAPWKTWE